MAHPKAFLCALSIIKVGFINRTSVVNILETPLTFEIIWLLFRQGYFVKIVRFGNYLRLWLRFFQNKPVLQNIKILYSGRRPYYVSAFKLKRYFKSKSLLVSTSQGILFRSQCIEKKIGGILIASLS